MSTSRAVVLAFVAVCWIALDSPARAVKRRVFVTSTFGNGNIASWPEAGGQGALTGGDNICRARAAAAGLPNATTYRVWLSTAATDAYCHVQGRTGKKATGCSGLQQAAGPWYLVNGTSRFSGTLDELTGPEKRIYQAVQFDELGATFDGSYWTGTTASGEVLANTCSSWVVGSAGANGQEGESERTAVGWTNGSYDPCSSTARLLCFEPGESEATPTFWSPSALVFVTSVYGTGDLSSWPDAAGANGIAAGDAICRNLATAAHLPAPDTFVAWLSDATTDARDRLTLTTASFRRVDNFRVAPSKANLLANGNENSVHVNENGAYIGDHPSAWTGSLQNGTGAGSYCDEWTSGTVLDGMFGLASKAYDRLWTEFDPLFCNQPLRLYCFSNVVTIFWDGFDLTDDDSRWSAVVP